MPLVTSARRHGNLLPIGYRWVFSHANFVSRSQVIFLNFCSWNPMISVHICPLGRFTNVQLHFGPLPKVDMFYGNFYPSVTMVRCIGNKWAKCLFSYYIYHNTHVPRNYRADKLCWKSTILPSLLRIINYIHYTNYICTNNSYFFFSDATLDSSSADGRLRSQVYGGRWERRTWWPFHGFLLRAFCPCHKVLQL